MTADDKKKTIAMAAFAVLAGGVLWYNLGTCLPHLLPRRPLRFRRYRVGPVGLPVRRSPALTLGQVRGVRWVQVMGTPLRCSLIRR